MRTMLGPAFLGFVVRVVRCVVVVGTQRESLVCNSLEDVAMNGHCAELSPDDPQVDEARIWEIVNFWNGLRTCGESGATTWEVLESLEHQVTECLCDDPPNIRGAESLTAQAALLIAGFTDL